MSKIIVPLHFAKLTTAPNNVETGFKKFYLRGEWFKLYNGASEIDVVLDRPLDNYVPKIGTITSSDTVLTAIEKLDYAIGNINPNVLWGSITGNILAQTDLIAYIAALPASTLQQVVNSGNGISNFGGIGNASIQSTNFTSNRTLYLNDSAFPTIRIVDNLNASNNLQIDLDTLTIDGVSYNWSTIVNPPASPLSALPFTTDHLTATNNQYVIGDLVWYLGNVYRCIANNDSIIPTSTLYWTSLGAGYPLVQQPADWNSTSGNNQILNKPTIPTVGTWGALNYPTWVSGTPFVKMTAAGTFALDTNTYLTLAVTSVDLTMPSAFNVTGNPITTSGTIAVTGAGLVSQYVRGDGTLGIFPSVGGGGGGSVYYLNGNISQGSIGGTTMYQLSKIPHNGAAANFTRSTTGTIASFITDAGDPNQLSVPAGVWIFEAYLSESGGGSNHALINAVVEKWNGSTITVIATGPTEEIINGNTKDLYQFAVSIPSGVTLSLTDRIVIQINISNANGKTVTLYTENSSDSSVTTTFANGISSLNGLTEAAQIFGVGTTGTDFAINSTGSAHTFNLPTASATNRGALSSTDWSAFNAKPTTYYQNTAPTGTGTSAIIVNSIWTHSDTGLQYSYNYDGNTYQWVQQTLPLGPQGPQGANGTNTINSLTSTTFNGILKGNGSIFATTTVLAELGFTPENVANKENTTLDNSSTKYPTNNLVKTSLDSFSDDVDYAIMTNQRLIFNF